MFFLLLIPFIIFIQNAEAVEISSSGCRGCHLQIAEEWEKSPMANPLPYEEGGRISEKKECSRCHSPLRYFDTKTVSKEEGITCLFCHMVLDVSVGKNSAKPVFKKKFDHKNSKILKKPEFCAVCHHFREKGFWVEPTYHDFKNSPLGKTGTCQDCHMPQKSHTLKGGHFREMLEDTAKISGVLKGRVLEISVENLLSGHSLPGGNFGRQLILSVYFDDGLKNIHLKTYLFGVFKEKNGKLINNVFEAGETRKIEIPVDFDYSGGNFKAVLKYRRISKELEESLKVNVDDLTIDEEIIAPSERPAAQ